MALIKLSGGFTPIPEGVHVFKITDVTYKEAFGKLEITMQTAKGKKHVERYQFTKKDGDTNDGALAAFSFMAKCALNDQDADEIDPEDLAGCFIRANVVHDVLPSTKKEGETVTFVRLTDKEPADGFDEEEAPPKKKPATKAEEATAPAKKFDLKSVLGN